jgi:hypothetical protein
VLPEGVECFAGDLPEQEKKLVWATHFAPAADLFNSKVGGTAWKSVRLRSQPASRMTGNL